MFGKHIANNYKFQFIFLHKVYIAIFVLLLLCKINNASYATVLYAA